MSPLSIVLAFAVLCYVILCSNQCFELAGQVLNHGETIRFHYIQNDDHATKVMSYRTQHPEEHMFAYNRETGIAFLVHEFIKSVPQDVVTTTHLIFTNIRGFHQLALYSLNCFFDFQLASRTIQEDAVRYTLYVRTNFRHNFNHLSSLFLKSTNNTTELLPVYQLPIGTYRFSLTPNSPHDKKVFLTISWMSSRQFRNLPNQEFNSAHFEFIVESAYRANQSITNVERHLISHQLMMNAYGAILRDRIPRDVFQNYIVPSLQDPSRLDGRSALALRGERCSMLRNPKVAIILVLFAILIYSLLNSGSLL